MCLKEGVREMSGTGQVAVCQRLVKRRACEFQVRVEEARLLMKAESKEGKEGLKAELSSAQSNTQTSQHSSNTQSNTPIWDIEELVGFASNHRACPYYLSREMLGEAELIFMPYNYLLDSRTRASITADVDLKDAIVIFDEAHNVEGSCYDAVSCELDTDDLVQAMRELDVCNELLSSSSQIAFGNARQDRIGPAKAFLMNLHGRLMDPQLKIPSDVGFYSQPGDAVFGLLEGAGLAVDGNDIPALLDDFEELAKVLVEDSYTRKSSRKIAWHSIVGALKTIYCSDSRSEKDEEASAEQLAMLRTDAKLELIKKARANYRMVITNHPTSTQKQVKRTLAFWCFNPGVVMGELLQKGVRSIILTSGTLSPMRSFIQEMQM